jgi:UDP-N-acetyl-alpha-D-muramoyl-L-alanyl-L-glutamate epimerase
MHARVLRIDSVTWSRHQLVMRFSLGELAFSTVAWYPDVDLKSLEERFGFDFMERLFVHAALFEANKIASLRPRALDLGPYARHHTEALERLWAAVFDKVWAQWRYENDLPDERPPPWSSSPARPSSEPVRLDHATDEVLLFCGGGKDSLVSMKLLERGGIPFAAFAYASSAYGAREPQFRLIDRLLDLGAARRRHRQIVLDDFVASPALELHGEEAGVRTVTSAETPSSIFGVLPILLDRGYRHAVLGHEASANRPNLVWARTGEDINHQWGKSAEAERLLDQYIRAELIEDVGVFSVLMPIHDAVIFELLRRDEASLAATHSCNVEKPWCMRCPKCAYVWLACRAHLSAPIVESVFPDDLLEVPENLPHFRQMVGLGEHTPFECIGAVEESRLALALCSARRLLGPAGRALAAELLPLDVNAVLDTFGGVSVELARLPLLVAASVAPQMRDAARTLRERVTGILSGS